MDGNEIIVISESNGHWLTFKLVRFGQESNVLPLSMCNPHNYNCICNTV